MNIKRLYIFRMGNNLSIKNKPKTNQKQTFYGYLCIVKTVHFCTNFCIDLLLSSAKIWLNRKFYAQRNRESFFKSNSISFV